jgi:uncharacterized membrane protein (DUF2068 family)
MSEGSFGGCSVLVILEVDIPVGTVAEGLVLRMAAAAQGVVLGRRALGARVASFDRDTPVIRYGPFLETVMVGSRC